MQYAWPPVMKYCIAEINLPIEVAGYIELSDCSAQYLLTCTFPMCECIKASVEFNHR